MRLFLGLNLPEAVCDDLLALCNGVPGIRWMDPENLHLTLRFIGEVDRAVMADLDASLVAVQTPAFSLQLSGIGVVGKKRNRVHSLWAGVTASPELMHLQRKLESAVVRAGIPPEGRKFTPHVTLGRIASETHSDLVGRFIQAHDRFRTKPFEVGAFHLYSSHLRPEGALHQIEAQYDLIAWQDQWHDHEDPEADDARWEAV